QSERQQLQMAEQLRFKLDLLLSVSDESRPTDQYVQVLAWKGAVSSRQQLLRHLRAVEAAPQEAQKASELEQATRQLANLSRLTPALQQQKEYRDQLAALSEQVEALERGLARQSSQFRAGLQQ